MKKRELDSVSYLHLFFCNTKVQVSHDHIFWASGGLGRIKEKVHICFWDIKGAVVHIPNLS